MLLFFLVDNLPPREEGDTVLYSPDGVTDNAEDDEENDDDQSYRDVLLHVGDCGFGVERWRICGDG